MQINFEAEQIKAAHAYVDRLTPIKITKKEKRTKKVENSIKINNDFYTTTQKEENSSFIKRILNFLFK